MNMRDVGIQGASVVTSRILEGRPLRKEHKLVQPEGGRAKVKGNKNR